MPITGQKFLVTGGASLIGSHLTRALLAAGAAEVVLYDNLSLGSPALLDAFGPDGRVRSIRLRSRKANADATGRCTRSSPAITSSASVRCAHRSSPASSSRSPSSIPRIAAPALGPMPCARYATPHSESCV